MKKEVINRLQCQYQYPVIDPHPLQHWHLFTGHTQLVNQRLSRACIVHLVIKKTNWSYVKTMSCSGSHLGITINIKKHKVCKGPSNDCCTVQVQTVQQLQRRIYFCISPYGPVLILNLWWQPSWNSDRHKKQRTFQ